MEGADTCLPEAPFEAFFTLNFLEHQPTPKNFLRGIWHNLVPQGIGLVEVPNFDMMLRQRLFSEFTTDHLLYFTADTLAGDAITAKLSHAPGNGAAEIVSRLSPLEDKKASGGEPVGRDWWSSSAGAVRAAPW